MDPSLSFLTFMAKTLVKMAALMSVAFAIYRTKLQPPSSEVDHWQKFKLKCGKSYSGNEDLLRKTIFLENFKRVSQHNKKYNNREVSFKTKITCGTSDMIKTEMVSAMYGFNGFLKLTGRNDSSIKLKSTLTKTRLPSSVDWRNKNAITPVKDQGQCGSCWAFSATGALEAHTAIKTGQLVALSEQNLVDCSGSYGNQGCDGGFMHTAFNYIKENGGIDTSASYPYKAENSSCRFDKRNVGATVKGYVDIPMGDEKALMRAVATVGPVAVAIDAYSWAFQLYSTGVFDNKACSQYKLNHAVLVVGYGRLSGKDFWLVKNSWGPGWGIGGYIRMSRNAGNQCGIASMACYPTV